MNIVRIACSEKFVRNLISPRVCTNMVNTKHTQKISRFTHNRLAAMPYIQRMDFGYSYKYSEAYFHLVPYGLAVRIPGFHPGGPGSTPGMGT